MASHILTRRARGTGTILRWLGALGWIVSVGCVAPHPTSDVPQPLASQRTSFLGMVPDDLVSPSATFPFNVVGFDARNVPYIRARSDDRHGPIPPYVRLMRGKGWETWHFDDEILAHFAAQPSFASAHNLRIDLTPNAAGWFTDRVVFDRDDDAYTALGISLRYEDAEGVSRVARRRVLLHSQDHAHTWKVYELPLHAQYAHESHSSLAALEGPPALLFFNPASTTLDLLVPQKLSDGTLLFPPLVRVSHEAMPPNQHAGGATQMITAAGQTYVIYGETSLDADPGVPTFVVAFDHQANRLSSPTFVHDAAPANDIHNVSGLAMGTDGVLHVLTGTHNNMMFHLEADAPHSIASFSAPEPVLPTPQWYGHCGGNVLGPCQTYVAFVHGAGDVLHLVYRQFRNDGAAGHPAGVHADLMHQRRTAAGWSEPHLIDAADITDYGNYYHKLSIDKRGNLYVSSSFYSNDWDASERYALRTLWTSSDGGDHWEHPTDALFEARTIKTVTAAADSLFPVATLPSVPVGGGEGYPNRVRDYDVLVATRTELKAALSTAQAGDVIYVADDAEIDLTGHWLLDVPAGVTLASGRGHGSLGALLFTRSEEKNVLISVREKGVRITGLRLRGPSTQIDGPGCGGVDATGIWGRSPIGEDLDFELDNNELSAWPAAAVSSDGARGVHVHHNHIHHNRRQETSEGCESYGLGYGVVTNLGDALIESNLFDHNRHDIASTGRPGSRYEARYNVSAEGALGHAFDMHGCHDRPDDPACTANIDVAGERLDVHHNWFRQADHPAVVVRGIPSSGAFIHDNFWPHASDAHAVLQRYAEGNLFLADNLSQWQPPTAWFISYGGRGRWKYHGLAVADEVIEGDFDGDGASDLLRQQGSRWELSRYGRTEWLGWYGSSLPLSSVRVGDFDGDATSDLFYTDGTFWYVSASAKAPWERINQSSVPLTSLRFGDFDGDGRTDVFQSSSGGTWRVSWAGRSPWQVLNSSSVPASQLSLGDFDGDGITDVLRSTGSEWLVSWSGRSPWEPMQPNPERAIDLTFCDFDGDRVSDAFSAQDGTWRVSYGARGPWQTINHSTYPLARLVNGDFNGDGRCDVLVRR